MRAFIMHARIVELRESVSKDEPPDLGVTEAALQVFNNFLKQVAATSPAPAPMKSTAPPELRRSQRFVEKNDPPPILPLPAAPLQQQVRAPSRTWFSKGIGCRADKEEAAGHRSCLNHGDRECRGGVINLRHWEPGLVLLDAGLLSEPECSLSLVPHAQFQVHRYL